MSATLTFTVSKFGAASRKKHALRSSNAKKKSIPPFLIRVERCMDDPYAERFATRTPQRRDASQSPK